MSLNHLRPESRFLLGFDSRYLRWVGHPEVFMDAAEIKDWIESVYPFLQDWYDGCLSHPENQHHLQKVRDDVDAFVKDMNEATCEQDMLAKQDNKLVLCPSHDLLLAKSSSSLHFRHYSAATACLIARYGIRGGAFRDCKDEGGWHLAAVMLLVSIIVDLGDGDHWASRFKANAKAAADAKARENVTANSDDDGAVAILAQRLHELSMQANGGLRPNDDQIEAMRLRISAMKFS